MRHATGDLPRPARDDVALLVADPERERAGDADADLLMRMPVLRHDAPGVELDDGQRQAGAADDPSGDAVEDPQPGEVGQIGEGTHVEILVSVPMADPLARETQKLYAQPLSRFTAARNARAKALKQDDPELAAAVAKVPKPSAAAGALNELVHEDPSEVRALIQSGKRLRQAQEAAVSGKKGADLNEAIQEHRTALDRVQRDLRRRKLSAATLDKATQTLRVASIDPELWPLLERGLLHEDLAASGFGLDPGIVPASPKGKPAPPPRPDAKRRRKAEQQLAAAEKALVSARTRAEKALREVEQATAEAERARRALEDVG